MELNSSSIHEVIHPTAAFSKRAPRTAAIPHDSVGEPSWAESQLNPRNRIDSLSPIEEPLWRIDGCTGLGSQYYALPLFLGEVPPMRFDVFIPEETASSYLVRQLLDLNAAFHTKDVTRVRRLGISRHIVRTLQAWTRARGLEGRDSVAQMYKILPFGSRIIFENLDLDIRNIKITVAPTYYVEKQLLSLPSLSRFLGVNENLIPQSLDIFQLVIVQQLHDSVCLVRINHGHETREGENQRLWIFKALTSGTKYLFTELRNLLLMEPHPHVISRPEYLVTKYCRFGGKTAVVGFLLQYHSKGGLRDTLPVLRIHNQLSLASQLKWAAQLASAVEHVRTRGHMFYPDLRLDNIVLSDSEDVVMVDFEQRGVWCEFGAPEVNCLEYTRILAMDDTLAEDADVAGIPDEVREHFAGILTKELPNWEDLQAREDYAPMFEGGYSSYNVPWLCLSPVEQEAAEVYMLGRVLWCIFEGQSAPQLAAVWQSYRWEPEIEFPEYRRTPAQLRDLIDRCTRGRRGNLSGLITRSAKSELVLRGRDGGSTEEVLAAAQQWWSVEVKAAEEFLRMRREKKDAGQWNENYYDRPTLREVVDELEAFRVQMGTAK
ncbi:ribosomal protein S6 kinase alpha-5 [Rhypophila decipiens]|uniref:Ribosomal protein S6 kinase alpha-5 n=1 Tax=Rhypophila decipiens TaxID=261697 RepID=A0AAN6YK68_9PEZI|nr:ribosomal protein S6 kinase alpha-5 [Rhypophila decipiens]